MVNVNSNYQITLIDDSDILLRSITLQRVSDKSKMEKILKDLRKKYLKKDGYKITVNFLNYSDDTTYVIHKIA